MIKGIIFLNYWKWNAAWYKSDTEKKIWLDCILQIIPIISIVYFFN